MTGVVKTSETQHVAHLSRRIFADVKFIAQHIVEADDIGGDLGWAAASHFDFLKKKKKKKERKSEGM